MTIRYKCKKCGATLYECSKPDYSGLLTPYEVAFMYNFTCPVCGSQLNPDTRNPNWREHIVVKPANGTEDNRSRRKKRIGSNRGRTRSKRSGRVDGVTFISSTEFIIEEL
jgi:transcription initiation factor IIE alpha subunit